MRAIAFLCVIAGIGSSGCARLIENWSYQAISPDRQSRAIVSTLGLKSQLIELRVQFQGKARTPFTWDKSEDIYVRFCELHWRSNTAIELLAINPFAGSLADAVIMFGYDFATNRVLPSDIVKDELRASIRSKYDLDASVDAIQWANTDEASQEFESRGRLVAKR